MTYKSICLRANVTDDGCAICRFLNGSRDVDDLMEVIRVLDGQLAEEEQAIKTLMRMRAGT